MLEFRNVSFHYTNAEGDVLHHMTFTARPGQTTAIIGSTGSGKSTLVNLIPRFYDVTEGEILLDGVDIRQVSQHDLRARIGYVPQKGVLFSGTIASQPEIRPPGYGGRGDGAGGPDRPGGRISSPPSRTVTRRKSPREAPTCPAGRSSGFPSPGPLR